VGLHFVGQLQDFLHHVGLGELVFLHNIFDLNLFNGVPLGSHLFGVEHDLFREILQGAEELRIVVVFDCDDAVALAVLVGNLLLDLEVTLDEHHFILHL